MQKYEILIEENAFGATRPIEVDMSIPISALLPELVGMLHLPEYDLFGKPLIYVLRHATSNRVLSSERTLADSGILPGMVLALDSLNSDGVSIPVASLPITLAGNPPSPVDYDLYTSNTLSDAALFSALPPEQFALKQNSKNKKRHDVSRRAFLLACGIACGVSGIGLGYAANRSFLDNALSQLTSSHRVVQQQKPQPTNATQANKMVAPKQITVKIRTTFTKHQQIVRAIDWSSGGKFLASGSDDTHVLIWDLQGNVQQDLAHPAAVHALALSPDETHVATGSNNQVAFWDTLTGKRVALSIHRHIQTVNVIAWTAKNEQQIVSVGEDKRAVIWDPHSFKSLLTYQHHTAAIRSVAWSADGKTVASGSDAGAIRVWNATDGQDVHGYYQDAQIPMRAVAFARLGTQLAVGGDDGIVRLWNGLNCINNGPQCMDIPQRITIAQSPVRALSWSPDGRFLAVGTNNGMFQLLQTAKNKQQLFAQNVGNIVRSIAWSPDSTQIAMAVGKQVMVWNVI